MNAWYRRLAGGFALVLVLAIALTQAPTSRAEGEEGVAHRPNVLLIVVDDLRNAVGCFGDQAAHTPNLDRLAARSVRFDAAYCQYPLCNPSRTSFLSGRRPDTTRIVDNRTDPRRFLGDGVPFLPELFHAQGYFTSRVGKIAHGRFEEAVSWDVSEDAQGRGKGERKARGAERAGSAEDRGKLTWTATAGPDEAEPDGATARRIATLIEEHKEGPFFIAAGFHKPHLPWSAPRTYFELHPPGSVALPAPQSEEARRAVPAAAFTRTGGADDLAESDRRAAIAAYYACASFMDAQVGLLLDTLDRLHLWETTVVVLYADHGFHLSEHGGLWRKMTLFEEAARVPLLVAAPGRKPASTARLVELVDVYPTLVDLCGVPAPAGLEGTSFVPLLDDPGRPWKKAAFTTVARGRDEIGRALRTERWRYAEWGDEGAAELYDRAADPREQKNLAEDPAYAQTRDELHRLLHAGWKAALPGGAGR